MNENGPTEKAEVQDQVDLLSEVIDELRYRPECSLDAALRIYFRVQDSAWRQYQDTLRETRAVWDDGCRKAYKRRDTAIAAAWGKYQDVSTDAWEGYHLAICFYDNKLRFIKHYTWPMYITDTSVVWSRYAEATKPAYHDYCNAEKLARHQVDCITTDATLKYKRQAREAWTKYQSIESPAWADLQQVRKELRGAPDVSLERFEE